MLPGSPLRPRSSAAWLVALALGALVAGCGHAQLLCPRQAGPAWHEYTSPHFAVATDLSPPRARSLVATFERTYRSFLDVTGWRFPGRGEPPGHMRVVVFAGRGEYNAVAPPHTDGFYRPESLDADAAVVIDNDGSHAPGEVFLHELTHRLVRYYVPNTPLALNEGLAEYFSTFRVSGGVAHTGDPPLLVSGMGRAPVTFPHVRMLMSIDSLQGFNDLQRLLTYVGGWFVVHAMARFHPQELGEVLARMADGESFDRALVAALGPDAWNVLNNSYAQAVNDAYRVPYQLTVTSWRKPYHAVDLATPIEERPIGDAALHLLWADLQRGEHDIAAQVALAEAHGGDSAQLAFMRAVLLLSRDDLPAAERELTAAIDARPDEERYRLTLARVHALGLSKDPVHGLTALSQDMDWLAQNAQSPDSLALVALFYALRGDLPTARVRARRALELDPTNARAYLAWAVVYASENDVDRAIDAAERSLRLTPEGSSAAPTKALVGKLHELRAHTRRAPPLPPLPPQPPKS